MGTILDTIFVGSIIYSLLTFSKNQLFFVFLFSMCLNSVIFTLGLSLLTLGLICFLSFHFLFIYLFIFLAALGLHCSARAFSSCGEWGLLFVAVRGLLIEVDSLVAEHGL